MYVLVCPGYLYTLQHTAIKPVLIICINNASDNLRYNRQQTTARYAKMSSGFMCFLILYNRSFALPIPLHLLLSSNTYSNTETAYSRAPDDAHRLLVYVSAASQAALFDFPNSPCTSTSSYKVAHGKYKYNAHKSLRSQH